MKALSMVATAAIALLTCATPHATESSTANSAQLSAVAAPAYAIGAEVSGSFYDPAQSGQGLMLEHVLVDGVPNILGAWFTYLDGQARWLYALGPISGNSARLSVLITSGADFPPRFVPGSATLQNWGELVLTFSDASHAQANWTSSFAGFNNGSMPLVRLTQPALADDSPVGRIAGCHSGAWYDPAQSGHGIFMEVIGSGANRTMLAIWYTYLNGEQRWLYGTGPVNGNTATLSGLITHGADFPPNFHSSDVVLDNWGTMTFTAIDADHATWQWSSTVPGFGSGSMPLARLTTMSGRGCAPGSDGDAARFLTQASFGPTSSSIAEVRALGYSGWIAAQKALPVTLQRPTLEQQIAAQVLVDPRNGPFYRAYRVERWFNTALTAPDQLRQRMAFALSQILVLSDTGTLDNNPVGVAEYNDILLRNAFGNYRTLLSEVTRDPAMGAFLTALRNQKTDYTRDANNQLVAGLISPDENYAREVMQLFSIGLIERNRDFSPLLVNGATVPTYSQDLITNTAKVLTGLSYQCTGNTTVAGIAVNHNCGSCVGSACQFSTTLFFSTPGRYAANGNVTALAHPDTYRPMVCYPRYADTGRSATAADNYAVLPAPNDMKKLLGGINVIPSPVACYSGTPISDQQACINYCDSQLNTLIDTLYMHHNVGPFISRQLIQRLTTSNPSSGYIDRVAAVFDNDGSGVRGNLGAVASAILLDPEARSALPTDNFGKLREPLLRLTAVWRAFGALPGTSGAYGEVAPERYFAQRPLGANSVFNFYEPDYQQPGEIADAGLFAPEFQILDESTAITTSDEMWRRIFNGYSITSPTATGFTTPASAAYLPPATLDALPSDSAGMVEALNQKLLYGSMSASMKSKLVALLDTDLAGADKRRRALDLIHLISISPEFAQQR